MRGIAAAPPRPARPPPRLPRHYGFVMSYPSDGQAETCFGYEPWHHRWIGREAAAAHRGSGLYLRQFLEDR
ncbi:MAG: D-alanyl-D-alanine carboxypeptidase family protein [Candidatus Limnocylindria bacterium]